MSGRYDFKVAQQIARDHPPFDALIMAAVMGADTDNAARLRSAFPELYAETGDRYMAPGGVLDTDGARS